MSKVRPIRVPAYLMEQLHKWRRAARALEAELGRAPEAVEVAAALGLPEKKLAILKETMRVDGLRQQGPRGGEEEGDILGGLKDERARPPVARLIEAEEIERMMRGLGELDGREADVLRLRFGLGGGHPRTLREIGEALGLTRERIRQIEEKATRKIRAGLGIGIGGDPGVPEVAGSKPEVTAVEAAAILDCSPKRFREIAQELRLEPSGRRHGGRGSVERLWRTEEVLALAKDREDRFRLVRREAACEGRELISTREAAAIFGLSRSCFQSTRPCGLNPVISKIGYGSLWDADEVRRFAEERRASR